MESPVAYYSRADVSATLMLTDTHSAQTASLRKFQQVGQKYELYKTTIKVILTY